jgi:glycosyltransferase involved in cell wall biosynthesis
MSHLPLVSVIIPTYNRSELLRVAVESVLAQTYANIEVIVVNDGSTDDTATVMEQWADRVIYFEQTNQGVAATRNKGLRAASGEYITFLDDDDFVLPTKTERQVRVLASRPQVGLVHCRYYYADEDGNLLDKAGMLPEGEVLGELLCGNFIWMGAPLIRRQCFDRVGLFDQDIPSVIADWDLWLRIALAGYSFSCVQEPLGAYRIQHDSMVTDVAELERATFIVFDKVFADPQLPADAIAVKDHAHSRWRFWISCRYYSAGRWDDAQRNLSQALVLQPDLLANPVDLVKLFSADALNPRVRDPFEFITNLLNHLPPCAVGLEQYRSQIFSRIYVGLALWNYGVDNILAAKRQLVRAVALDPAILEQMDEFAESLYAFAMHLPISAPLLYVDTVLQNLPPEAQRLARVRGRVLSDVNIGCAFQDYFAGRRLQTVHQVLTALRHRPTWLKNRGVVSMLLKSIFGQPQQPICPAWRSRNGAADDDAARLGHHPDLQPRSVRRPGR